ncbi:MAG: four helix bundle protein [Bradymonadaceae bacterium]
MEKPHRKLKAWQAAIELASEVYGLTARFPDAERYELTTQLRTAASSVPSNIAEGASRGSDRDYARFLHIARGSLSEVDTRVEIALRVGYLSEEQARELDLLLRTTDRLIAGLIRALEPYS